MTPHEHHHDHAHAQGADRYEQAFSKYNLHLHARSIGISPQHRRIDDAEGD